MPDQRNTHRLRALMDQYDLSPQDVADLLHRSYQTVLIWRSVNQQTIPDNMLDLLEMKLAGRKGSSHA